MKPRRARFITRANPLTFLAVACTANNGCGFARWANADERETQDVGEPAATRCPDCGGPREYVYLSAVEFDRRNGNL